MEVSGKVLREVEFRDRLRGYDTDEVDEFLEKVAVGVDELLARISQLEAQLAAQPAHAEPGAASAAMAGFDDDAIRRTLVLAQRTADLAVSEAREEAARLLDEARAQAESVVARAEEAARRLRSEAEQELQARVSRLNEERDRLEREVQGLARVVEDERSRVLESLDATLRYVRDHLFAGDELKAHLGEPGNLEPRPQPGQDRASQASGWARAEEPAPSKALETPSQDAHPLQPELPDVEAEVHEDAASAAWSPRPEPGRGHVGPARPMPSEPAGGDDAEEALWERWAAGRDLGVVPGPADFGRRSAGTRGDRDRGWSA
jgi:cell division initiation protein